MPSFGFIGPGYQMRGLATDCQRWLNLHLERVESGRSASPGVQYQAINTPGKQLLCTFDDGPCAAVVESKSALPIADTTPLFFCVYGSTLYYVTAVYDGTKWVGTSHTIGTVSKKVIDGTGGQLVPAQIIVIDPTLLFVVTFGNAYVAAYGQALSASALNDGGNGYAVGDTGRVTGGKIPATYIVTSVSGTGAVTGYTITYNGTGYAVSNGIATETGGAQPGVGFGFTINITAAAAIAWLIQQQTIPEGTLITDNFIATATWMDGYVIISLAQNEPDPARRTFYISGLNDPTNWNALSFDEKEANSDPVVAVFAAYEILMVFGSQTIELWQDSGNLLSAFQRLLGGGVTENGLAPAASWAVSKMDDTVCWLGSDARGQYVARQLVGNKPVRISNHAIENTWRAYNTFGASSYSYVENGHSFWVLHFPIPDKTWVYDSTIGPELGWHERAYRDDQNVLHADIGRYHGFYPEIGHAVGDYRNNNLYLQSIDILEDNCAAILRERVTPHLCDELKWSFYHLFRLHCLRGRVPAAGDGSDPQCTLEVSNDGAQTFGPPMTRSMGRIGEYQKIIEWWRLGRARDRVYRWRCSEPIDFVLVDSYIRGETGNG